MKVTINNIASEQKFCQNKESELRWTNICLLIIYTYFSDIIMSLNVNFEGKAYAIKASKKFADLKKTLKRKIPDLEKQDWEFYYYDDEGDNIQVGEEEEYQSLFDFAKSQKASVKCEINYKNSSKVEQRNQQMNSDKQSEQAEVSQQQQGSDIEESSQGYEAAEFQKSQPDNDQEEPPKNSSATNSTNDSKKTPAVETKKQDPKIQEPQNVPPEEEQSELLEEQSDEDEGQQPPYVKQTESKLVDQVKPVSKVAEPKNEVQQKIIQQPAQRQKPAVKVQQPKAQPQQPVGKVQQPNYQLLQSVVKEQRQHLIQAQQPEVKKPKQKRKNETVKAPRVIEELPNAENAPAQAESQVITVTIPKEEYERLLSVQQAYHNRQFQLADHEFASGIKSASSNMRCTFCCMDENLNVMPSFENLLICDNCNQKYEIKLKVKPFRSKMSRNSSALSGNRLF